MTKKTDTVAAATREAGADEALVRARFAPSLDAARQAMNKVDRAREALPAGYEHLRFRLREAWAALDDVTAVLDAAQEQAAAVARSREGK
jgi:hypothetical protein